MIKHRKKRRKILTIFMIKAYREVSERFKEHDWKSCVLYKGTEGSNPFLSAKQKRDEFYRLFFVLWFAERVCKEKNDGIAIVRNEAQSRHGSDGAKRRKKLPVASF